MVRTLQPGQDWVWCYVDEMTLRHVDGGWVEVDLFFEAGLGYMRDHLRAGGDPNVDEGYHRTCSVEGYTCTAKRDVHSDGRFVTCTQGGSSVRFTWLPA